MKIIACRPCTVYIVTVLLVLLSTLAWTFSFSLWKCYQNVSIKAAGVNLFFFKGFSLKDLEISGKKHSGFMYCIIWNLRKCKISYQTRKSNPTLVLICFMVNMLQVYVYVTSFLFCKIVQNNKLTYYANMLSHFHCDKTRLGIMIWSHNFLASFHLNFNEYFRFWNEFIGNI